MNISSAKAILKGFSGLFFPDLCHGCNRPLVAGEQVVCLECDAALPETNYHNRPDNEAVMRFAGRFPFEHATSLAFFFADGLLQHLLHGLKYNGQEAVGDYLGRRLATALADAGWGSDIDLVIPVPLHPKKKALRGYNQSYVIGKALGARLNIGVSDDVLQRVRNTDSQTKKTREERLANMKDAFTVGDREQIAGKHILIVDDVLTTGATIEACALALKGAAPLKISIATIGIAMS